MRETKWVVYNNYMGVRKPSWSGLIFVGEAGYDRASWGTSQHADRALADSPALDAAESAIIVFLICVTDLEG